MPDIYTQPEVAYLLRPNIVHPASNLPGTQGDAQVAAAEAAARAAIQTITGATVTGGAIKKGK